MKIVGKKAYLILPMFLTLVGTQSFSAQLKTGVQTESYSIGASTGNYIVNQVYRQVQMGAKIDTDLVLEGFSDALKKKLKLSEEEIITNLNNRVEYLNKAKEEQFHTVNQT